MTLWLGVLLAASLGGCSAKQADPPANSDKARIAELEKKLDSLARKSAAPTPNPNTQPSEKDPDLAALQQRRDALFKAYPIDIFHGSAPMFYTVSMEKNDSLAYEVNGQIKCRSSETAGKSTVPLQFTLVYGWSGKEWKPITLTFPEVPDALQPNFDMFAMTSMARFIGWNLVEDEFLDCPVFIAHRTRMLDAIKGFRKEAGPPKQLPAKKEPPKKEAPAKETPATTSIDQQVVKEFEHILDAAQKRIQVVITKPTPTLDSTNFWGKTELRVRAATYDVQKTNSVISPFTAKLTMKIDQLSMASKPGQSKFKSEEDARAADHLLEIHPETLVFHFAWQKQKWVYKSVVFDSWVPGQGLEPGTVEKKTSTEPRWPFTRLKNPGEIGAFSRSMVVSDGEHPPKKHPVAITAAPAKNNLPIFATSPDGKVLLKQDGDNVLVFDPATNKVRYQLRGSLLDSQGFSASGAYFIQQAKSETILFQTRPWKQLRSYKETGASHFSTDEKFLFLGGTAMIHLATGKSSGKCSEWAFENYENYLRASRANPFTFSVEEFKKFIWGPAAQPLFFSPDANYFVQTVYKKQTLFETKTRKPISSLKLPPGQPLSDVHFLADGKTVRVNFYDTRPRQQDAPSFGLSMSSSSSMMMEEEEGMSMSRSDKLDEPRNGGISDFDIATGKRRPFKHPLPWLNPRNKNQFFQVSPTWRFIVMEGWSSAAGYVYTLHEIDTGKSTTLDGYPNDSLGKTVFSPDEQWVAYPSYDAMVYSTYYTIINTGSGAAVLALKDATDARFDKEGNTVTVTEGGASDVTYELPSGKILHRKPANPPSVAPFSPDGRFFTVAESIEDDGNDKSGFMSGRAGMGGGAIAGKYRVQVIETATGKKILEFKKWLYE
ncbi:MAG: hypothetical protein VX438_07510 [Planctomycetota bacterium]|nr:hypothetical protein [Planctomycetota bacterium]